MPDSLKHRRWFQFRLRTVLVAMTLCSLLCGWILNSHRWINQRHRAVQQLFFGSDFNPPYVRAPGGLWLFGEKGVESISLVYKEEGEGMDLKRLFPEAKFFVMMSAERMKERGMMPGSGCFLEELPSAELP